MITTEDSTGRLLVRLMVKLPVVTPLAKGTVISGGCHAAPPACADPFNATQLPVAALAASQVHPHMGTVLPSGRVAIWRDAVRVTVTWASEIPAVRSRTPSTKIALLVILK